MLSSEVDGFNDIMYFFLSVYLEVQPHSQRIETYIRSTATVWWRSVTYSSSCNIGTTDSTIGARSKRRCSKREGITHPRTQCADQIGGNLTTNRTYASGATAVSMYKMTVQGETTTSHPARRRRGGVV